MELTNLPNIGIELSRRLVAAGITSAEALQEAGSCRAFEKIRQLDSSACLNTLYALEGAVQGVRWHRLTTQERERLKEFYHRNSGAADGTKIGD